MAEECKSCAMHNQKSVVTPTQIPSQNRLQMSQLEIPRFCSAPMTLSVSCDIHMASFQGITECVGASFTWKNDALTHP